VFFSIFKCFSLSNSWWSLAVTAANKWPPDNDSYIEWIYQSLGFSLGTPPATQWTTDNAVGGCAPTMKIIRGNQRAFDEEMTPIMSLFQDHDNRDFSISYLSGKFPVHKCWLGSTSLYFKRMVSSEWKETNMCEVEAFDGVSSQDFAAFLKYLYLQPKETLIHHGPAIWKLCDYFEVSSFIKKSVFEELFNNLSVCNATDLIPIVNEAINNETRYGPQFYSKFSQFIAENSKQLAIARFPFAELSPKLLENLFFHATIHL
jgi:hypothetical protein